MRFLRLFQATYAQVVVVTMTTTVFQTVYGAPSVVVDQEPASLPADWTLVFPDTMLNSSTTRTGDNITYSFRSPNSVTKPFLGETSRAFDVDPTVTSSSITSSSVTSASGTTSTSPPLFFGPTLLLTDMEHERYAPHDRGGMKLREEAETVTVEYPTFGHTVNQGITVTSMFTTEEATKTAVPIVEAPKEKEKEEEKEEGRFTKERKKIQKVLDALFGSGDEDDTGTGKEETEKKSLGSGTGETRTSSQSSLAHYSTTYLNIPGDDSQPWTKVPYGTGKIYGPDETPTVYVTSITTISLPPKTSIDEDMGTSATATGTKAPPTTTSTTKPAHSSDFNVKNEVNDAVNGEAKPEDSTREPIASRDASPTAYIPSHGTFTVHPTPSTSSSISTSTSSTSTLGESQFPGPPLNTSSTANHTFNHPPSNHSSGASGASSHPLPPRNRPPVQAHQGSVSGSPAPSRQRPWLFSLSHMVVLGIVLP